MPEMISWRESWENEKNSRESIDPKTICNFGIAPLDDALIGLLKNDLLVIGADSGAGKSSLCLDIAIHNAKQGRKVALYFIEGGEKEATARIKWRVIADKYYSLGLKNIDMDYRKWRMNLLNDEILKDLEYQCLLDAEKDIKANLDLYSFEDLFSLENLINSLGFYAIDKWGQRPGLDIDLIIIDHLQYFTLSSAKSELTEMTQILTEVKRLTQFYNVPVILVSHLRKKDKDRGLPGQEDFYGTSNIAKIASVAVTIASNYDAGDHVKGIYPTFFRFVKSRTGLRSDLAFSCNYDLLAGSYQKNYKVYKLMGDIPIKAPLSYDKWPKWARNQPKEVVVIGG